MSVAAPPAVVSAGVSPTEEAPPRIARARTVALAMLALFLVYGTLSLLNDPRGTLGTDTGGKLASLRAMDQNGGLDPDLGYWAARFDPDGSLHPLFSTERVGSRWVNLTTLPMAYAAYPLYEIGGERAVLLLPMLGAVMAALAARALARRVGRGDGWWAFWAVGLATPLVVYALDFWEHAPGVALVLWGLVFLVDVRDGRAGWRACVGAGALFGLAATMRTEALVYAAVITGLVAFSRWRLSRRASDSVVIAGATGLGVGVLLFANQVLERATLGDGLRAARAGGTATQGAADLGVRVEEAFTTTFGLNRFAHPLDWLAGATVVIALALFVWTVTRGGDGARRIAAVALGVAGVIYAVRFADGFGFVPGLLTASPLAIAGLTLAGRNRRDARLAALALAPLPLVWLFQFSGGAGPQWGGRYVLTTGLTLGVVGIVAARRATRGLAIALVVLGVAISACGVAWLSVRSHAVADAMEHLVARHDEAVLSREAHLLREGGAFYAADRKWLTATDDREVREAVAVLRRAGVHEVAVIAPAGASRPATWGPFHRKGSEPLELLPGVRFSVTTYRRA